jgi:hypothetical protein
MSGNSSLARLRDITPDQYTANSFTNASPSLLAEAIIELANLVNALTEEVDKLSRRELITDDEGHVI